MIIPNNIILTYRDDTVPSYVFNNIKRLNSDKNILFFTDLDVINFLLKEYDSSYADFFKCLTLGCAKGDFFRYCYLLKYGGYYCDIDIEHIVPICEYTNKNLEFFSINSGACINTTFQALLYCTPEHEIILNSLRDLMKPESAKDAFYYTTRDMYKNIQNYLSINSITPKDYTKNDNIVGIGIQIPVVTQNRWATIYNSKLIGYNRYQNYEKINPGTRSEVGYFK